MTPDPRHAWYVIVVSMALAGVLAAAVSGAIAEKPPYTRAATESCLMALPDVVDGLPPPTPPVPPILFVDALAREAVSTWGVAQPTPRAHTQLGAWYGDGRYEGIILSFFRSSAAARVSLHSLAWLYGGKRLRNVVVTWDQKSVPTRGLRSTVLGCLRSGTAARPVAKRAPAASLATFTGGWGGHGRGLSITATGRGREGANDGCCTRVYQLTFDVLSVSGTLTRATAVYRVVSFQRYERGMTALHVGEVGKLELRDGIVTDTLTGDFFCSTPAWGVGSACGA